MAPEHRWEFDELRQEEREQSKQQKINNSHPHSGQFVVVRKRTGTLLLRQHGASLNFATTEKHYGARRSAQAAATEIQQKLSASDNSTALVGGLMGGIEAAPQLDAEELKKLKSLLKAL